MRKFLITVKQNEKVSNYIRIFCNENGIITPEVKQKVLEEDIILPSLINFAIHSYNQYLDNFGCFHDGLVIEFFENPKDKILKIKFYHIIKTKFIENKYYLVPRKTIKINYELNENFERDLMYKLEEKLVLKFDVFEQQTIEKFSLNLIENNKLVVEENIYTKSLYEEVLGLDISFDENVYLEEYEDPYSHLKDLRKNMFELVDDYDNCYYSSVYDETDYKESEEDIKKLLLDYPCEVPSIEEFLNADSYKPDQEIKFTE